MLSGLPLGQYEIIDRTDVRVIIKDVVKNVDQQVVVDFSEDGEGMTWYVPPARKFSSFRRPD
jgi:hypothetical protein